VALAVRESVVDKFKYGGENAISKTRRQDEEVSSWSCQSFNEQITLTSLPFLPRLTFTCKVMELHNRVVAKKRVIYNRRQINKHRL
jgi:hypothetical protein